MTLDSKILRGLFKHERLKLANIRTNQGNVQNLAQLKQIMNMGLKTLEDKYLLKSQRINLEGAFIHKGKISICT